MYSNQCYSNVIANPEFGVTAKCRIGKVGSWRIKRRNSNGITLFGSRKNRLQRNLVTETCVGTCHQLETRSSSLACMACAQLALTRRRRSPEKWRRNFFRVIDIWRRASLELARQALCVAICFLFSSFLPVMCVELRPCLPIISGGGTIIRYLYALMHSLSFFLSFAHSFFFFLSFLKIQI